MRRLRDDLLAAVTDRVYTRERDLRGTDGKKLFSDRANRRLVMRTRSLH